jgi:hypothetical protein
MLEDSFRSAAEAYALRAPDPDERAAFEGHLSSGCAACQGDVKRHASLVSNPF